jgi:hypothetical protein
VPPNCEEKATATPSASPNEAAAIESVTRNAGNGRTLRRHDEQIVSKQALSVDPKRVKVEAPDRFHRGFVASSLAVEKALRDKP